MSMATVTRLPAGPDLRAGHLARLRRYGGALLALALALGLGLGTRIIVDPRTFPVTAVQVEGELRHVDRAAAEQLVAPHATGSFFTVDVDAIRVALVALPWVRQAEVRRVWPRTLRVVIAEQEPWARWGEHGVLSTRGEVFMPPLSSVPPGLPRLVGPAGTQALVGRQFRRMSRELGAVGGGLRGLSMDARHAWTLELAEGTQVVLGRSEVPARLRRFVAAYAALRDADAGRMQRVDLRYTNGMAVRWTEQDSAADSADGARSVG